MGKIKWLFFDLGSTLVDETECYKNRIDTIVGENNIDKAEFLNKVYEYAKVNSYSIKCAADEYAVSLPKWNSELEYLYPNVHDVLKSLSEKYKLGIIANQVLGTKDRLVKWEIYEYFSVVAASAEEGCAKPDLKIFYKALERANCTPGEAVMIGDRLDNDIVPAKKIGMKTIWVKQGFAEYQENQSEAHYADCIIDKIDEIENVLRKI